jgi:starvation-inducible DNA-binding protein
MTNHTNLVKTLNKQVANWIVLFIKLHNFHWYVSGDQFFTLYLKFEELYTEAALQLDLIAERLLATNGLPIATIAESLKMASINEANGKETASEMVIQIYTDFNIIIEELKEGIHLAQDITDEATADLLTTIRTSLEKHVWMLKSYSK